MAASAVSIREFRAHLAEHVDASAPVAVTRHGRTVGFFIPVKTDLTAEIAAFKSAADQLDELLSQEEREAALAELDMIDHEGRG